ncbi:hypothetical protein [Streptomyces sp. NPDC001054]
MTAIRVDVATLLRAGHSDAAIARELHTAAKGVARARAALGLPKARPGKRPAATAADLFRTRVAQCDDGHLQWAGARQPGGCPVLRHAGRLHTAHRIAWTLARKRPPVGHVRAGCGRPDCVEPAHLEDAEDRARYRAIFGTALTGQTARPCSRMKESA